MSNAAKKQSVLILGSGMVSPPAISYLASAGYEVTVASRTLSKAELHSAGHPNVKTVAFDVDGKDSQSELDVLTSQHDLIISLLPYIYHVRAAKLAIKHKKHFCTTSYVSPEMAALEEEAKKAGIVLLNECGVDPGLDHMSAKKVIDEVHAKGGKVISFTSICGGLPAPSADDNPFRYKLSWSPRGVLLASRNNAVLLRNGQKVTVPGTKLYDSDVHQVDKVGELGHLEWYFNRDSTQYADIYGIPEVQTIVRGTYRNVGWCRTMKAIAALGLNSTDEIAIGGLSYHQFFAKFILKNESLTNLKTATAEKIEVKEDDEIVRKFDWLGLFSTQTVPTKINTALDAVCHLWEQKLQYASGEKDMIVMKHTFVVEYASPSVRETITSTLIDYGHQPSGHSSMARTVSLPVAIAVRAILDGRFSGVGLVRPVQPALYNLILSEMETLGVKFVEKVEAPHLWIRVETKPGEERVAIVPRDAKKLIEAGYRISVEKSPLPTESSCVRCIGDEEYAAVGCELVRSNSWNSDAPLGAIVVGLKELPESKEPLLHRHVFFAHCYKNQGGWTDVLQRFISGAGLLWDLEFLHDDNGRRVAAFGRPAGIVGMALALLQWAAQQVGDTIQNRAPLKSWKSNAALIADVKAQLQRADRLPSVIVLGALGRCGGGAVWIAKQCGVTTVTEWDLNETKAGGPFKEIVHHDILVNAIYLSTKIPPFITQSFIDEHDKERRLAVIADVSCDTSNPNNPLPIYTETTTLAKPLINVIPKSSRLPLDMIAIDHLPSLVPLESSEGFSADLLATLLQIKHAHHNPVWKRAEQLFYEKSAAAKAAIAAALNSTL